MTDLEFQKRLKDNPALREALELGLSDQWKFSAEPILSKTGRGFLRSAGVSELASVKEKMRISRNDGKTN